MSRLGRLFALVLALLIAAPTAAAPPPARAADILNVPGDFSTIQSAIDAAVAGDTVLVGPGTYTERPVISKDITVESSDGPQTTFIDGNLAGTVVTVDAEAAETPVLRGFTIRRGNHSIWAGIRITGDALIEDNVITESCDGYAVVAGNSSATIRENVISGNGTPGCGSDGGLSIGGSGVQVLDNVIADNTGVGIHLNGAQTSLIARNVIRDNGGGTGGGIEMINAPNPVIVNNLITGNAGVLGPGIYWNSSEAGTVIANNTIVNNTVLPGANLPSSGVYVQGVTLAFVFANNIIASSHDKPALYCAGDFGGNAPPPSHNDIWNSVGSAVEGVCSGLVGTDSNVSIDPKFADPGVGDFHLRPDSPLIDAGREANAPSDDFDGDARPHDGDENGTAAVDIGFDEAVDPVLIEPSSVDFGEVVEDVPSTAEVVTLENFGDAPLSVTGVAISGDDAADFTVTDETCTDGPIAASATCDVTVIFTPSAIGEHDASLSISGPDPVGTRTIALTGAGLDSIVVEPADVAAPATSIGTTATAGTVMVTNRGGSAATVTSVSIGGTNAADFTVSNQTCTAGPIATDDDCTISIQFGPKAVGSRSATLTIQGPAPVGTRNVSLAGTGEAPPSGITWGSVSSAGPSSYTWNAGGAFARTLQSTTQRLHVAYATDRVGGKWATNTGPYAGVYYVRGSNGTSWSTPKRLNPSTQHAIRLGLAASSSRVYAVWVSQRNLFGNSASSPRVLYFRANTNYGSSTAWGSTIRLSSTSGTVDYPTIAASGTDVHVAWTHAGNGEVRLSRSQNRGGTWTTAKVGSTTATTSEGKAGVPSVAVSGSTVVVAWIADNAGTVKARISTNRGVSWGSTVTLGNGANSFASTAIRGTRIAVAWTTISGVVYRQRVSGTWGAPMLLADLSEVTDPIPYAPVVALQDSGRIGVTWSEQSLTTDDAPLRWIESANGGTSWFEPESAAGETSSRRLNDWASVIWVSPSTRYVVWNGWVAGTDTYHLYFRKGTGTPISPTSSAPAWKPVVASSSRSSVEKQVDLKGPKHPDRR